MYGNPRKFKLTAQYGVALFCKKKNKIEIIAENAA
jgi:hypothetical protein